MVTMETQELIQQLSNTGNALWEASLKQNSITLVQGVIMFGISLVSVIVGAFVLGWALKHDKNNPYDDYRFLAFMFEGIFFTVFIIVIVFGVLDAVTIIGNPEWAAADRILGAIGD